MKVLFVCTGNTCRSPMAEALFRKEAQQRGMNCECRSAGIATFTGSPASDNAVAVMKEIGVDISGFRSTSIKAILADEYDIYVPMTFNHAQALVQLGIGKNKIYLFDSEITDPYGGSVDFYRKTRDELSVCVKKLADFIQKNYGDNSNDTSNDK